MKRTTKKLSGVGLELFLRRFYSNYGDIDEGLAKRLAKDGRDTFASVRVRRIAWRDWRGNSQLLGKSSGTAEAIASKESAEPATQATPPKTTASTEPVRGFEEAPEQAQDFDPYEIGLVPIYQREGADGLLAKLNEIASADNLRKMARSQQVALPVELRVPDADVAAIRHAIVAAVGKRIANRRAAAG